MAKSAESRETDKRIGTLLAQLRAERGLRQLELARLLRTSQSMVSKVEAGGRSLRVRELPAYAAALEIDPQELAAIVLQASLGEEA